MQMCLMEIFNASGQWKGKNWSEFKEEKIFTNAQNVEKKKHSMLSVTKATTTKTKSGYG